MPRKKDSDSIELMLARSLFRADKWDPERDVGAPFEWEALRSLYIQKSNRLIRTLEKDGLQIAIKDS